MPEMDINGTSVMTDISHDSSNREASLYCLQCHSSVASGHDHMKHTVPAHCLISTESAIHSLKRNLETNMDNINSYFFKLHQLKTGVQTFEEAHEQCKKSIKSTAQNLIRKIQEHETRILDELETHRDIEYKRTGLGNKEKIREIENNLFNLQQLCSSVSEKQNSEFLENFELHREQINSLMLEVTQLDVMVQRAAELRPCIFSPIRCNTAFGTLDIHNSKLSQKKHSRAGRKTSLCFPQTHPHFTSQSSTDSEPDDDGRISPPNPVACRKFSLQVGLGFNSLSTSPNLRRSPTCPREGNWSPPPCEVNKWSPLPSDTCSEEEEPLELLWSVDTEGPALGQTNCPSDVCFLPDGSLVVSDRGNKRLQLFNSAGNAIKVIAENKIKPCRVHCNKNGHIIVSDSKDNNVCVYDKKGNCQSIVGKKLFKSSAVFKAPGGVASRSGKQFIVSDLERNDVKIYSNEGKVIKDVGKDSNECIEFKKPSYITTDSEGRILVSDNLNHCVKVFDSQGKYLFQCVLSASKAINCDTERDMNYLKYPNGVCCDAKGDIYVADWGSHTVSHFSRDGEFINHVLTREDGIYHPAGIAIMDNQLAVCSYSDSHSSVQVFKCPS